MPAPANTDELFDVLRRSSLLSPELLRTYQPAAGKPSEPRDILSKMTADGVITPFHAKHLAAGRVRGFFLADKYKLLAHLGTGGMGHVYLAEHLLLHRLVAVKVLQTEAAEESGGAIARFFREARAVAALDHPNIVRVFDMDRSSAAPFMVMEYVDGSNLHSVVAKSGPMTIPRAANYARQAALGLQHAHAAGLVHRDVKPGNLLVDRAGVVKVLDLGLARFNVNPERNKNLTTMFDPGSIVGTADFIAPEQTYDSSAVDIRADIYGLGGTLYYFLTGRSPFEHGTVQQKLLWHQTKPPPPMADFRKGIPDGLVAVVLKMLAKNPDDRYATPQEVAEALAAWDRPVPVPTDAEMPKVPASAYRLGLSPSHSVMLPRPPVAPTPIPAPSSLPPSAVDRTADDRPPVKPVPTPKPAPKPAPRRVTPAPAAPSPSTMTDATIMMPHAPSIPPRGRKESKPPAFSDDEPLTLTPSKPPASGASSRWWLVGAAVALLAAAALALWLILGGGR